MSSVCAFVIPGQPVPWARARGGDEFGGFYNQKRQRTFKRTIGQYAQVALLQASVRRPLVEPIWLTVRVFLDVPSSWRTKHPERYAEAMAGAFCIERPDLDNWVKLPMDALQGLAYVDDSQVVGWPNSGKWFDHGKARLEIAVARAE